MTLLAEYSSHNLTVDIHVQYKKIAKLGNFRGFSIVIAVLILFRASPHLFTHCHGSSFQRFIKGVTTREKPTMKS